MSAVPNIKCHFASSNVTAPGFAVPGAITATTIAPSTHNGVGGSPMSLNSPSTAPAINFFTNASSSYQSHFGDFGSGGMNIGVLPGRSSSNTSAVSASVGVVGGGVPSAKTPSAVAASSLAALNGAPAPIGTTPPAVARSFSGGSPCSAPLPISTPSSQGNSPHIASLTPAVRFAAPTALGSPPSTAALSIGLSVKSASDDAGPVGASGRAGSTDPTAPSTSSASGSGARRAATTSVSAAVQAMDEMLLCDANPYATFALSAGNRNGNGMSHSPTSPVGPYSGTPSPTTTTPRADVAMPTASTTATTVSSPTQLTAQPQQPHPTNFSPTAPLTPVSAQSSSSRHSNPGSREAMIGVYDSDFKTLLSIPASQVVHRPHPSLGVSRLVLCRNFTPEHPERCTKGELCKFVHADVASAGRCSIHVNYAWRSLELCTYPRLPAGDSLTVLAPNERPPSELLPSDQILVTRGSVNWREHTAPLSHCAHYYFNRMCNRGERCNFIHAVHVDPSVQGDFKRAPAPTAVAPIAARSPTSPALRSPGGDATSALARGGTAAAAAAAAVAAPPPPPPPPPLASASYGFAPTMYSPPPPPPPPPGAMGYSMAHSPTALSGGGGPYMFFANPGCPTGAGFVPTTLVPPPPANLGNSNGVYLLVPAHPAMAVNSGATPGSPVSPLGQSLGSLSNGPIDWSFYGDLETAAWMPPSPSSRI